MGWKTAGMKLGWAYRYCEVMAWPPMMLLTRRDWQGVEHLGEHGRGTILAANHLSLFDPIVMAHFMHDNGRPPRFMAKSELFDVPVVGQILHSADQIPVYRGSGSADDALRAAVSALQSGECVMVYPEGTLTRDPELWPMMGKTGAVRLALESGADLVPVAQWGAQEIMRPYAKEFNLFPPKTMHVLAGPPIDLSDLIGKPLTSEGLRAGTDRLMAEITGLLSQLRGIPAPVGRYDPNQRGYVGPR
jgi:1-acyl-sn-glycerol-3-phosphate acyltransferase